MKTIGQFLNEARRRKKYSLVRLEELTKIKKNFLKALEDEDWENLPTFATVSGFVKNIASVLEIDEKVATATLKRDYPVKELSINPRPDISTKFVWSPKLTFAIGVGTVLVAAASYLGFQYKKFISPPFLVVYQPQNEQVVNSSYVVVEGMTDTDAKLVVNNQPVITDQDGNFKVQLKVARETKEIVIQSISRSGKETLIRRSITVRPD